MVKAVSEVSDGHGLPENINISAPVYYSGAEAISARPTQIHRLRRDQRGRGSAFHHIRIWS